MVKAMESPKWGDHFQTILEELKFSSGVSMDKIQETDRSTVLRLSNQRDTSQRQSIIVKITHDVDTGKRTHQIQKTLLQRLHVQTPTILTAGEFDDGYWLAFSDVVTSPVRWSERRFHQTLRTLVHVHKGSPEYTPSPTTMVSHTPHISDILHELQRVSVEEYVHVLHDLAVHPRVRLELTNLLVQSHKWHTHMMQLPLVISHGDYHTGNVLYAPRMSEPFIIDWEYAHWDAPYFDLFQFLDATSPTDRKRAFGSRLGALNTYWRAMTGGTELPAAYRRWVRGYLKYAAIHLLWILTRIHSDQRRGSFTHEALRVQTAETIRGLLSIQATLRKV